MWTQSRVDSDWPGLRAVNFFFGVLRTLAFSNTENELRKSQFAGVRSYAQQSVHHMFLHCREPSEKQVLSGFVLSPKVNLPAWFPITFMKVFWKWNAPLWSQWLEVNENCWGRGVFVYFFCSWTLAGRKRTTSLGVCVFRCTNQQWEAFLRLCTYLQCRGRSVC